MKKRWIALSVVSVVLAIVLVRTFGGSGSAPAYESAVVARGDVVNVVSVTGHVEPVSRVSLSFPLGGRIASLQVHEGDQVEQGTVLATLAGDVMSASLAEAEARLSRERAVLRDLVAPLRATERAVKDAAVQSKERALAQAAESAYTAISHAYVYADDAVREKADELFNDADTDDPSLGVSFTYGTTKYYLQSDNETTAILNEKRRQITDILASLKTRASERTLTAGDALQATEEDIVYIQDFLNVLAGVINRYIPDDLAEQTVYETFQTSIAAARTSVSAARTELTAARKEYDAAETAVVLSVRDLELADAGAHAEAIEAQEAAVAVAESAVGTAAARARESVLTAPLQGTVARIDPDIGEVVAPYETVALLLTEGAYELEVFIPEADIANVKLGDKASITFDAFERTDMFSGEVVRMALSETVREGVPTYKTTLVITNTPDTSEALTLRPGMTANVDITTDIRDQVLYVPTRALTTEGNRTYVRMWDGTAFVERDVKTGLRGSEGTTEIVSGLAEGEEVVLFVEGA